MKLYQIRVAKFRSNIENKFQHRDEAELCSIFDTNEESR